MELQKQFSFDYLTNLKNNLFDPEFRKKYEASSFVIENNEDNIVKIPGLYNRHVDLKVSEKPHDRPSDDFENAIVFFEAYKEMSPIVAAQESVWAYFTHVEYFDYVKQRWQITNETSSQSMIDHFFVTSMLKIARNGIARLWWPVYLTYDKDNSDPYHLTKLFFSNTQAVLAMSESILFTCKPLIHGVLEFFEKHPEITPTKANIDTIMQYFNKLGGVRVLAFESKENIIETIESNLKL